MLEEQDRRISKLEKMMARLQRAPSKSPTREGRFRRTSRSPLPFNRDSKSRSASRSPSPGVRCYECSEVGHVRADCPTLKHETKVKFADPEQGNV